MPANLVPFPPQSDTAEEHACGETERKRPLDTSEERAQRVIAEARRLANLTPGEWKIWIQSSAERLNISRVDLEQLVKETLKDKRNKEREAKTEERRQEQRIERQRTAARRERECQEQRIEKEAERKRKDKERAFSVIVKLPSDQHTLNWRSGSTRMLLRCGMSSRHLLRSKAA